MLLEEIVRCSVGRQACPRPIAASQQEKAGERQRPGSLQVARLAPRPRPRLDIPHEEVRAEILAEIKALERQLFGDQDASGNLRLIRSKLLFSSPITNDVEGPDYDSGKHQYAEKAERSRHDRKIHRLILNYAGAHTACQHQR